MKVWGEEELLQIAANIEGVALSQFTEYDSEGARCKYMKHLVLCSVVRLFGCLVVWFKGHPDNVAPAIYGGIQLGVSIKENDEVRWMSG